MDTLQIDQPHEGVTRITLDRPERLNAMNAALIAELHQALAGVAADRACRVVVLTGAGRGFCAGLDLAGYGTAPGSENLDRVGATFATQTDIAALVPRSARPAAAGDRRRERSGGGRRPRPGPGQRHPHRIRVGTLQRGLRAPRSLGLRHRRELAAAPL